MADQTSPDKEFEDYLAGKSELSGMYQHSTTQGPSEFTDKAILNAAKQAVSGHAGGAAGKYRWKIPVTIAAGLAMAVIVYQVIPGKSGIESKIQIVDSSSVERKQIDAAAKPAPDRLLENITTHINNNDLPAAQAEYKLFRDLFPNYEIDYQKYPKLKSLAN